jgi:hypothetical protein
MLSITINKEAAMRTKSSQARRSSGEVAFVDLVSVDIFFPRWAVQKPIVWEATKNI